MAKGILTINEAIRMPVNENTIGEPKILVLPKETRK
jgi:hypothetical protein